MANEILYQCSNCGKDGRVILDSEGTPPIKKEDPKDEQDKD